MKKLEKSQQVIEDHVHDSVYESDSSGEDPDAKQSQANKLNSMSSESEEELPIMSIRKSRTVNRKTGSNVTDNKEHDESANESENGPNKVPIRPVSEIRVRPGPKSSKNRKVSTKPDAVKNDGALFDRLFDNVIPNPDMDRESSNREEVQKPGPKSKKRTLSSGSSKTETSLTKTNRRMRISSVDEEIEPTKEKSLTLPKTPPPNSDAKIMSVSDVSPKQTVGSEDQNDVTKSKQPHDDFAKFDADDITKSPPGVSKTNAEPDDDQNLDKSDDDAGKDHKDVQDNGGDLQMPHSRPLRNSFCKALVRMSSHLVEDTNSKKKAATNANSEALRLAKESLGNKSVQIKLTDLKDDLLNLDLYEPALTYWKEVGQFKTVEYPDPTVDKKKTTKSYSKKKVDFDVGKLTEKLFHKHFDSVSNHPTNSMRSRALVSILLDDHRAKCPKCDIALNRLGIRLTHKPPNQSVNLINQSNCVSNSAMFSNNSSSALLVEQAKLKTLLAEKEAKIKALEKKIEVLLREVKNDEATSDDIIDMLNGVSEPTAAAVGNSFHHIQGFRLLDMRIVSTALQSSQKCKHGSLVLVELHKDTHPQEDLASRLVFVCTVCGPKTIFPTSSFSRLHPENFTVNKQLLPLLGPSAYYRLASFLQFGPDLRDYAVPSILQNVRPQMVLSIDNNIYDLRRPFEPPLPTDPNANICQQDPKSSTKDDPDPIAQSSNIDGSSTFKLRSMSDLIATKPLPSAIRLPSLLPQPAINVSPQPTLAASEPTNFTEAPSIILPVSLGTSQPLSSPQRPTIVQPRSLVPVTPSAVRLAFATSASQVKPVPVNSTLARPQLPGNSTPANPVPANAGPRKIRACPELPAGSRIVTLKPGTKVISSNVQHSTQSRTGLAPGVYRVQHGELPDRILVIDHEPGSNMTPPAIIANVSVTQPNSTETTSQMPTIAGVCSLITGTSTTTSSGQVKIGTSDNSVVRPVIVPQRPIITPIVTSSTAKSTTLAPREVETSRSKTKRRRRDSEISSDSIMTLSSDNESEEGNNTDLSGESIIEPYNPSQKTTNVLNGEGSNSNEVQSKANVEKAVPASTNRKVIQTRTSSRTSVVTKQSWDDLEFRTEDEEEESSGNDDPDDENWGPGGGNGARKKRRSSKSSLEGARDEKRLKL